MSETHEWIQAYAARLRERRDKAERREAVVEAQSAALWERFAEKAKEFVDSFNTAAGREFFQFKKAEAAEFSITFGEEDLLKAEWRAEQKCVECAVPHHEEAEVIERKTLEFDVDAAGNLCFAYDEHLLNAGQTIRELLEPVLKHVT
jgi:hypothetical protein